MNESTNVRSIPIRLIDNWHKQKKKKQQQINKNVNKVGNIDSPIYQADKECLFQF